MLEEMVASVMKKTLAQDFPHLKLPAAVFATIDSAAKSDAFDIEELIVHNEVTGEVFKAHITSYWYEYKLTVIDRFGNPDANYPALPGIKSKKPVSYTHLDVYKRQVHKPRGPDRKGDEVHGGRDDLAVCHRLRHL